MPFQKGNDLWKQRKAKTKHGMSRTRIYQCWADMKSRCFNEKNRWFPRYGGRGITVCDEWLNFETFWSWAKTHGYKDDLTIERIDNDANYCPSNCRWATQHEQSMNKTHIASKTGAVGIRWRANRYQAEVCRYGKTFYVGRFKTLEEAISARNKAIEAIECSR